jgi:Reverse transcriptase (RNA-dependent DNA polymerase)
MHSGMSSKLPITRSIIQGLGIGSTTFIAMIADLQPLHNTIKFCKYADDLTVVIPGSLTSHGNKEIENEKLWAIHNKLIINTSKSKEIVLCRQGNRRIVDQPVVVSDIQQVAEVKLLGVWLNRKLSFYNYVNCVLTMVNQRFIF